ncbi:unnamed protein product [Urochloa humidicola]
MPKKHLAEEVWRLQVALGGQYEITKCTKQEYKRLQNEKVLCRICYKGDICMVLLPYRHRTLSVDQLIVFLNTFAKGRYLQRKEVQCYLSLFDYQARDALPSKFVCDYAYASSYSVWRFPHMVLVFSMV